MTKEKRIRRFISEMDEKQGEEKDGKNYCRRT
mgnify:CR=1 FL=1